MSPDARRNGRAARRDRREASAELVALPLLLLGLGIGALASQLSSLTVSAVRAR
jgi:hypothetical protein